LVDRSIIGKELESVSFPVEAGKVMELARALHDDHSAYRDEHAARDHGFGGIPAPLTVTVLAAHWNPDGAEGTAIKLGMSLERLLHGETVWEYFAPVHAGDRLTAQRSVADVAAREGKRGGRMTLVTLQTEYTNQHGELTIRQRDVLIEREGVR
jgi:acyl dehydratase